MHFYTIPNDNYLEQSFPAKALFEKEVNYSNILKLYLNNTEHWF